MADEPITDDTKTGARNSAADKTRIRELRVHGREIDRITRELEPDDDDEPKSLTADDLASYGSAVKALGDGRVGGYLVRYGNPKDLDLTGDFFDAETEYGVEDGGTLPVYYQHGQDGKLKNRRIGRGKVTYDEVGLWLEAQLEMRDEYERGLYALAEAGKLGYSSGAAGHLVEREPIGKASRIKSWPIGEASLTPTPAEPRNVVIPVKSFITLPEAGGDEAVENQEAREAGEDKRATAEDEHSNQSEIETGEATMDETEVKTLVETAVETAVERAIKSLTDKLPVTNAGGVQVTKDEGDQAFENDGEFFKAVKLAALYPGREDPRLRALKATGMSEGVPADGGYLLRPQVKDGILERMYATGALLSRVARDPVEGNSMTYNGVDETSRATGSRYGGVQGYWLGEGGTITASKPKFRQIELKLKKVAALCYATDEQLEDTRNLESWLNRVVPGELRFQVEDAIYEGDGVGKPLGIMNSPALVTVQRDTASAIKSADVLAMWARRWAGVSDYVWFINQDALPQLPQMTIGNQLVYAAPGGLSGSQYGSLFGRPVIEIEYASTLNTTGDIMLASLSQYQTIDKGDVKAASSIHVAFTTAEQAFRFIYRVDGEPLWNSPLTPFKGTATQSPFVVLGSASA